MADAVSSPPEQGRMPTPEEEQEQIKAQDQALKDAKDTNHDHKVSDKEEKAYGDRQHQLALGQMGDQSPPTAKT